MGPAAVADLHELLAWHREQHPQAHYVFFRGSMGGASNLIYAVLHPQDVAAVVALGAVADIGAYVGWCRAVGAAGAAVLAEIAAAIEDAYGGSSEQQPRDYRAHNVLIHSRRLTMLVFLAHGEHDALMPVEQSRALAAALSDGPSFRYIETPGDHDSPLELAGEAVDWLRETLSGGGACQSGQ
jgi:pimeloyl-ACP methyl ester carboxylesterase